MRLQASEKQGHICMDCWCRYIDLHMDKYIDITYIHILQMYGHVQMHVHTYVYIYIISICISCNHMCMRNQNQACMSPLWYMACNKDVSPQSSCQYNHMACQTCQWVYVSTPSFTCLPCNVWIPESERQLMWVTHNIKMHRTYDLLKKNMAPSCCFLARLLMNNWIYLNLC